MTLEEIAHSRRVWLLAGMALLATGVLLSCWQPSGRAEDSICFLRRVTGLPCPGCGLTRGFTALARGDLARALKEHPLSPLFAVEAVVVWLIWGMVAYLRKPGVSVVTVNVFLVTQVVLLLTVWGLRLITRNLGS